jgi:hypothetical protein
MTKSRHDEAYSWFSQGLYDLKAVQWNLIALGARKGGLYARLCHTCKKVVTMAISDAA